MVTHMPRSTRYYSYVFEASSFPAPLAQRTYTLPTSMNMCTLVGRSMRQKVALIFLPLSHPPFLSQYPRRQDEPASDANNVCLCIMGVNFLVPSDRNICGSASIA